jgi:hypothetical protein
MKLKCNILFSFWPLFFFSFNFLFPLWTVSNLHNRCRMTQTFWSSYSPTPNYLNLVFYPTTIFWSRSDFLNITLRGWESIDICIKRRQNQWVYRLFIIYRALLCFWQRNYMSVFLKQELESLKMLIVLYKGLQPANFSETSLNRPALGPKNMACLVYV